MRTESGADPARKSVCNLAKEQKNEHVRPGYSCERKREVVLFRHTSVACRSHRLSLSAQKHFKMVIKNLLTFLNVIVSVEKNVTFLVRSIRLRVGRQ